MKKVLLALALWSAAIWAHNIEQVSVKIDVNPKSVQASLDLDAELLLGQKSDEISIEISRDWLHRLGENEHLELRKFAYLFIKKSLHVSLNGEEIDWDIQLPNYESKPYIFPSNFENNALIKVELNADLSDREGELEVHWTPYQAEPDPTLIIQLPDETYVTVATGGTLKLATITANEEVQSNVSGLDRFFSWLYQGFVHILPRGYDHILFIMGLVLLCTHWRPILNQSLLFTLSHSITLFIATQGWLDLPIKWVEVFIALSIVYVGIENLWLKEIKKQRYYFVFAFGLLHGFGFASVLGDILDTNEGGIGGIRKTLGIRCDRSVSLVLGNF